MKEAYSLGDYSVEVNITTVNSMKAHYQITLKSIRKVPINIIRNILLYHHRHPLSSPRTDNHLRLHHIGLTKANEEYEEAGQRIHYAPQL